MNGLYQTWSLVLLQAFLGFHDIFPLKSQNMCFSIWIRFAKTRVFFEIVRPGFVEKIEDQVFNMLMQESLCFFFPLDLLLLRGVNHFLNFSLEKDMVYSIFSSFWSVDKPWFWLPSRVWMDGVLMYPCCYYGIFITPFFQGEDFGCFSFLWFSNHPKKQFSQLSGANKGKGPTTSGNPHHEIQSDHSFPPAERNELYYVATIALR